jgi:transglutaminase-like putative cysteine protease
MRRIVVGVAGALGVAACVRLPEEAPSSLPSYPTLQRDDDPIDPYGDPLADPAAPALHSWEDGEIQDVIPVDAELGDPRVIEQIVVRVRARFFRLPETLSQHVDVEADGVQRVTVKLGPSAVATAADRKAALAPTAAIDSRSEVIRTAARVATEGERDARGKVNDLVAWIDTHISYEITDEQVASGVLINGKGDCAEQSLLFIAMARASGVPARRVLGLVPTVEDTGGSAFGYHAWAEVAIDGHWVPVDPTWNEPIADAAHITLSVGEAEVTADELDGLSLAVAELTRGPAGEDDPKQLARDLPVHLQLRRR